MLEEYRKKRKFTETPEPSGQLRRSKSGEPVFVVQKHDATSLHYDFRLEIGGVLVSWAVPKGPSINPADKRLAMRTEDHPMEYARFEGVIPVGHYGAGPVMVWDIGSYTNADELPMEKQLERGELKFTLHGQKLEGGFVLVHTRQKQWLLIKHRDEYVDRSWDITVSRLNHSALSGLTLDEIAAGHPRKKRKIGAARMGA